MASVNDDVKTLTLVCAKCEKQAEYHLPIKYLTTKPRQNLTCTRCNKIFETRIVNIRSKRSRGDKRAGKRDFDIRVINFDGSEDFIQFTNNSYEDMELRSKDLAAFSYYKNKLVIVQNFNVDLYWKIKKGCYLATYVYGAESPEVATLQRFRDDVLLQSKLLSWSVPIYYRVSPKLIDRFGDKTIFRLITKALLKPIILIINLE